MQLTEVTGLAADKLPVAELRAHLRMGTGFDDTVEDALLEGYLRAAIQAIETRTGKAILARRFSWIVGRWNPSGRHVLPIAPVVSIDSIVQTAPDGAQTAYDLAGYALERDAHRPAIRARSGAFPYLPWGAEAEVVVTAGMAESFAAVPSDLRQAILILAATYFDYRHGQTEGGEVVPFGVMTLIEPYRAVRLGRGSC